MLTDSDNPTAVGVQSAYEHLLPVHRGCLKSMVCLRLSRRLQGRVDEGIVLQEADLDLSRKLPEYPQNQELPSCLWLRHLRDSEPLRSLA